MENVPKFMFYNFEPREGVDHCCNTALWQTLEEAPSDANCTALIEKIGPQFFFEIVIRSHQGMFHCEKVINTERYLAMTRDWQTSVVELMRRELRNQLNSWRHQRFFS